MVAGQDYTGTAPVEAASAVSALSASAPRPSASRSAGFNRDERRHARALPRELRQSAAPPTAPRRPASGRAPGAPPDPRRRRTITIARLTLAPSPCPSSIPKTCARCGWFSVASVCASRANRATRSASDANRSAGILIATSRCSLVSARVFENHPGSRWRTTSQHGRRRHKSRGSGHVDDHFVRRGIQSGRRTRSHPHIVSTRRDGCADGQRVTH